jgi:hypothetical protein
MELCTCVQQKRKREKGEKIKSQSAHGTQQSDGNQKDFLFMPSYLKKLKCAGIVAKKSERKKITNSQDLIYSPSQISISSQSFITLWTIWI